MTDTVPVEGLADVDVSGFTAEERRAYSRGWQDGFNAGVEQADQQRVAS